MPKHIPERTCLVTREARPQGELLRFALGPENEVVPDLKGNLPGRGAWVTPTAEAVAQAARRRLFSRAFKTEARAPDDLAGLVDALLVRDLQGALALAVKAGAATTGFGKVEAACLKGEVRALVHAREAAPDGRRKLAAALRKGARGPIWQSPPFDDLSGAELDVAFGREGVIHAALLAGAGSEGCVIRWRRLRRYRGLGDDAEPKRDIDQVNDTVGAERAGQALDE
ncbi:MAG: RNA-binding protein [Methylobacteriaceae bacterium]|nr:RNA-binding protein [Methylobacteriaceae bacterium]